MATQRINLEPLLSFKAFNVDPCDGIESVRLVSVMFDDCVGHGRFQVTLPRNAACDMYSYLQQCWGEHHPLMSHQFQLIGAYLAVRLHPIDTSLQRTLAIKLLLPDICHLPKHPIDGHPLGESYLQQWGVLSS